MAKITRKHQKIFAGSATNNGVFGSAQVGTKVLSNDPDTIQGLAAFDTGWNSATISGERLPTIEEMQGLQFLQTRQIAYLLQEGVAEYDVGTEYHVNSIVKKAATYELYGSIINTNTGNALGVQADTANWKYLGDLAGLKNAGAAGNLTGAVTSVGLATSLGSFTTAQLLTALSDESSSPTASTFAIRDTNANASANNFLAGFATTATAAGTTVLTVASKSIQEFTGSTTQTITLPVVSTLVLGQSFKIINKSTGALTVNSSGGNLVQTIPAGLSAEIVCVLITGTTAASWDSLIQIGANSLATSGYQIFAGGLIIQWGTTGAASTTFPIAFPTAAFNVVCQMNVIAGTAASESQKHISSLTTTGFSRTDQTDGIRWVAFGN